MLGIRAGNADTTPTVAFRAGGGCHVTDVVEAVGSPPGAVAPGGLLLPRARRRGPGGLLPGAARRGPRAAAVRRPAGAGARGRAGGGARPAAADHGRAPAA